MKTPTINSRVVKLEVLKGTATRTSVNAVEARTTSLEGDVATAQSDISTLQGDVATAEGDISTLQGDVATLTQGIQDAVSTHNTAPDSHADLRTLIGDRALSAHQHARTDLPWVTEPGAALLTAASASAQRTALGMTAWAVAPWTDGTTSDIPEGTQLYFTNARADARISAQKGQADGIMPLDSSGKAPLAYIPDSLIGQVKFKGVWDAATNSPVLPSATTSMGHYYVTSVAGAYGGIDYGVGDWCISDGTTWGKVDNSDAITSFAGRVGAILPISSDYSAFYLGLHAQADDAATLGGQLPSYYAQSGHVHNYAGSSTPGGAATSAEACTGNANTATKWQTPRTLTIGAAERTVDGTSNVSFTLGDIGLGSSNNVSFASMSLSSSASDFVGKFTNTAYAYAGAFCGHLGCYSTYRVDGTSKGDFGTLNTLVSGGSVNDFGVFVRGDNKVVLGTNDSPRVEASSAGIRTITPPSGRSSSPAWRLGDVADGYAYVEIGGATFKFAVLPP